MRPSRPPSLGMEVPSMLPPCWAAIPRPSAKANRIWITSPTSLASGSVKKGRTQAVPSSSFRCEMAWVSGLLVDSGEPRIDPCGGVQEFPAMLRDRYDPVDLFALVPQLGLEFEPQLAQLDRFLDDDELFARVRADLARRYPLTPVHGRRSTPVEVILRMLVVMRLYGWSYAQAEYFVHDSLVLRQFCRVYLERVPDDTTLIRWANTIGPEALRSLNDRVVQLARSLKVTRGRKLRVDTTAVETDIHFPTDSGLVGDGVRVVSRLLRRAKAALGDTASGLKEAFRSRVRTVRRLSQQLHRIARRKGDEGRAALTAAYGRLIATAKRTAAQGRRVLKVVQERIDEPQAGRLAARLAEVLPRLKQGIRQAERRVLKGESVPADEKLLSLFEPHTQVIPRFKAGKAVE